MDITSIFKACVKTLRTRNKALGIDDKPILNFNTKGNKVKSEFAIKAKEVVGTITKMRDFLLEHRKDYITLNHILNGVPAMTDSERDKIDSDAQMFMQMCVEVIKNLKQEVSKTLSAQLKDHQTAVTSLIDQYLKAVCKIYSGQKAIRVKQALDRQKMLRLETDFKKIKSLDSIEGPLSLENEETHSSTPVKELSRNDIMSSTSPDVDFSPEELQMFEEENQRLYEDMNTLVDEIREIEGKVVEVGRLQEILSEKVLQQDQDINRVSETIMGTTENIKEGNAELREAMKKNAGLRVWILFILIVLSFSLLFLDWYSP
ncbi:hypothetical protein JTE90_022045 [Oedothorax gibbosus]|uniref:Syntaxin-18 n=1 Tax=Oedothorax gibbosus TaxID=931172 RepID=A0AAV6V380_9ARAC|nr:hypothetical protein JTE90_022045 [Oedothorax gibbosus]